MEITLVAVISVDGKLTRGEDPHIYEWTSPEDKEHFFNLVEKSRLIIMGRKTYEAARSVIKLKPETLRVVVTHQPEALAAEAVPGQLEFSSTEPEALVKDLTAKGYTDALLVGGSSLNAAFLKAGLVTELMVTVEPWIFGHGLSLVKQLSSQVDLSLVSATRLNEQGTLMLRYTIQKNYET
jgi:dihydrofolate reductase